MTDHSLKKCNNQFFQKSVVFLCGAIKGSEQKLEFRAYSIFIKKWNTNLVENLPGKNFKKVKKKSNKTFSF